MILGGRYEAMDFHGSHGEVADDMDSHGLGIAMVILPAYHGDFFQRIKRVRV